MFPRMSYENATQKAEHFRGLGVTDVYISTGPLPWHLATHMEKSGRSLNGHHSEMRFWFKDEDSGLTFQWYFDIVSTLRSKHDLLFYQVDVKQCRTIVESLNPRLAIDFKGWIDEWVAKLDTLKSAYLDVSEAYSISANALRDASARALERNDLE